jgi:hypothetical protein
MNFKNSIEKLTKSIFNNIFSFFPGNRRRISTLNRKIKYYEIS